MSKRNRTSARQDAWDIADSTKSPEVKDLERVIVHLDTIYHSGTGQPCLHPDTGEVVTDNEYDGLRRKLMELCPDSNVFTRVHASTSKISARNKILHSPPMTSIDKCNADTEKEKHGLLCKWMVDCWDKLGISNNPKFKSSTDKNNIFCLSWKHDGIACSLEYENGRLICAGTRSGSGQEGENITDKMKYVDGVPQQLRLPLTCTIRGELETPISVFEKVCQRLGDDAKENPRAQTSGAMGHKTADKMKHLGVSFVAYNILNLKNPPYETEIARAIWANKELGINFVRTTRFSFDKLAAMEKEHKKLDYEVDGIVISVNRLDKQVSLGNSGDKDTGNPRGKIAYKFKDEIARTKVKDIEWGTGRTGDITPVLIIEPVRLEGTTVERVTAHNLGRMAELGCEAGSVIEVIKSGKIIPKIYKVIKATAEKDGSSYAIEHPCNCPSCLGEAKVEKDKNTARLYCDNPNCPAQNIKMFNHFLSILGVKGVAESSIEKLIDTGLLQEYADFYRLVPEVLILSHGYTERTALLVVASAWMIHEPEQIKDNDELRQLIQDTSNKKIKIPMEKFFASFGISNAGRECGRILAQTYKNWDKIKSATEEELKALDGIGPTMAKEVVKYFKINREIVKAVENYFEFEVPKSGGKLEGQTFVLSGSLEKGKGHWKEQIESQAGVVKSSVGKSVTYLVAGGGSGAKSDEARQLGIKILSVEDLEKLLSS